MGDELQSRRGWVEEAFEGERPAVTGPPRSQLRSCSSLGEGRGRDLHKQKEDDLQWEVEAIRDTMTPAIIIMRPHEKNLDGRPPSCLGISQVHKLRHLGYHLA
ncbi:hypothetical protein GOP47_0014458 [Adiantum capillus-veneris]|uniref:Uncharacterized protein n=1 Tax=Adiantum capillus-veneris TaxID=13818 RepID=A0A9D4ULP5_ADICA|nr:hypothetical protein GOP47_0014458 [Adiantum capillus-veneris]